MGCAAKGVSSSKQNRLHVGADILSGFFRGGIQPIREQTHPQIRLPKGVAKVLEHVQHRRRFKPDFRFNLWSC